MIYEFALPNVLREHPLYGSLNLIASPVDGVHLYLLNERLGDHIDAVDNESIFTSPYTLQFPEDSLMSQELRCIGIWHGFHVFSADDTGYILMIDYKRKDAILRFDGCVGYPEATVVNFNGNEIVLGSENYIYTDKIPIFPEQQEVILFEENGAGHRKIELVCNSYLSIAGWKKSNEYNYVGIGKNAGKHMRLGYGRWICDGTEWEECVDTSSEQYHIMIQGISFTDNKYILGNIGDSNGWWEAELDTIKCGSDFTMTYKFDEANPPINILMDKQFTWSGFFQKKLSTQFLVADTACWR